jgi:hypothetical protein
MRRLILIILLLSSCVVLAGGCALFVDEGEMFAETHKAIVDLQAAFDTYRDHVEPAPHDEVTADQVRALGDEIESSFRKLAEATAREVEERE